MWTIWKFPFTKDNTKVVEDGVFECVIDVPAVCRILHADRDGRWLSLWVMVVPTERTRRRVFAVYGTGCPIEKTGYYVGTVIRDGFVWHVFDKGWIE